MTTQNTRVLIAAEPPAPQITLYGHPFSRAHRCLWMLKELETPFEHVPTGFQDGGTHTEDFLRINPNGRVPALVIDGEPLFESLAINLHLARLFGGELAPQNDREAGLATQWSFWVATEVEKPLLLAAANLMLFAPELRRADELALALKRLDRPFRVLDARLAAQPHLMGGRFTVADLNVSAVMSLVQITDLPVDAYPHMKRWLHACLERPAAADWKPIRFTVPRPSDTLGMLGMFV